MSKIAVLARITAKDGRVGELTKALQGMMDAVEREPGTLVYALHQVSDDPNTLVMYELYSDGDAFAAHSNSEAMKALGGSLGDLVADFQLTMLEPVGTAKGL
jgi:quinol monooxygenase YgiN